jgi:hypothetical protein
MMLLFYQRLLASSIKVLVQDMNISNLKSCIFVFAGLSLLEYPGLKAIDPAYALPVDVVNRIFFGK